MSGLWSLQPFSQQVVLSVRPCQALGIQQEENREVSAVVELPSEVAATKKGNQKIKSSPTVGCLEETT